MTKVKKINPLAFDKEVRQYQKNIRCTLRGQAIYNSLSEVLPEEEITNEMVTYIHAVLAATDNQKMEPGRAFAPIAVKLLFCLMTPYNVDMYDSSGNASKAVKYMAKLTEQVIDPLREKNIVWFDFHSAPNASEGKKGQCRKFHIVKSFYEVYKSHTTQILFGLKGFITPEIDDIGAKIAPRGEGFTSKTSEITIKAWEKVRRSQFVFDSDKYYSPEGTEELVRHSGNSLAEEAILYAMNGFNYSTNKPQYPVHVHLQSAGRMHMVGGVMQMPKWFRKAFIKPTMPQNIAVDIDMKCAQLLLLCDILGADDVKGIILKILATEGSIWGHIGDNSIAKEVKKVIVYAFCYGADLSDIPFLATRESMRRGYGVSVEKSQVEACLSGIVKPLVSLRDEWLSQFTAEKVVVGKSTVINDLGLELNLVSEAKTLKKDSTKVGAKYLAHLAQGAEQFIIQSMIADVVEENILVLQYDGMTIECHPMDLPRIQNLYESYLAFHFPDVRLDFEVVGGKSQEPVDMLSYQTHG